LIFAKFGADLINSSKVKSRKTKLFIIHICLLASLVKTQERT